MARQWGTLIRAFRVGTDPRKPRWTIVQAAEAVGVTAATWSRWEHGHITPRDHHKVAIAEFLGVAPSVLFALPSSGGGGK